VELMLAACTEELATAGLGHYEVSAYAHAGRQCRHNLNYWAFGDYLGVGAGAHGKITDAAAAVIVRTTHTREPRRYQAGTPLAVRTVPAADLAFEFMMNALRLTEGFAPAWFEARTGLRFEQVTPTLLLQQQRGLLRGVEGRWAPTPTGLRFLNDLLLEFLPDSAGAAEPAGSLYTGQAGHFGK
jgi:coproporphyrinogen III oxidase-like Fe-S oxidoreductase